MRHSVCSGKRWVGGRQSKGPLRGAGQVVASLSPDCAVEDVRTPTVPAGNPRDGM